MIGWDLAWGSATINVHYMLLAIWMVCLAVVFTDGHLGIIKEKKVSSLLDMEAVRIFNIIFTLSKI